MSTGNDVSFPVPSVTSPPRSLNVIKEEIAQCQEDYAQSFLKIGRLFLEAKEQLVEPGKWLEWVKKTDYSITKVQRLMRIAKKFPDAAPVPYLDYSKAYILSRLPECEIVSFLNSLHRLEDKSMKQGKELTKRELEFAVRNHLKLKVKNRKPSVDQVSQQAEVSASAENDFLGRIERIKSDVSELASLVDTDSVTHDAFAAELCELCQSIIQQLSPEGIEDD